jgi:cation diffusion facilitator family transporter
LKKEDRRILTYAMTLSLVVGIIMLVIKLSAYLLTGSSAILSDASESVVHIVAVGFAFYSLRLSYKPADSTHPYGHEKISFFSAGFEGAMIVIAAVFIIYEAVRKWISGLHLENIDIGTGLTLLAFIINGFLGFYLIKTGRKKNSLILEANGKHVLTDSYTSFGVLIGLGLTFITDWLFWDPVFAILIAINILYSGAGLMRKSFLGLMDSADPEIQSRIMEVLNKESERYNIRFHNVLHRDLGSKYRIELHLLFPDQTPIAEAHRIATEIEKKIEGSLEQEAVVTTHLEAIEDHKKVHSGESHSVSPR